MPAPGWLAFPREEGWPLPGRRDGHTESSFFMGASDFVVHVFKELSKNDAANLPLPLDGPFARRCSLVENHFPHELESTQRGLIFLSLCR